MTQNGSYCLCQESNHGKNCQMEYKPPAAISNSIQGQQSSNSTINGHLNNGINQHVLPEMGNGSNGNSSSKEQQNIHCNPRQNVGGNACEKFVCQNNGKCKIDHVTDLPVCECVLFYSGKHCEISIENPCGDNPCENGGKCIVVRNPDRSQIVQRGQYATLVANTKTVYFAKCDCPYGFSGENCSNGSGFKKVETTEDYGLKFHRDNSNFGDNINDGNDSTRYNFSNSTQYNNSPDERKSVIEEEDSKYHIRTYTPSSPRDPCQDKAVCLNGGKCIPTSDQRWFHCNCLYPWSGEYCESDMTNPCLSQICLHGGHCRVKLGRPKCKCRIGFAGHYCERRLKVCSRKTCRNGGVCLQHKRKFSCVCRRGFFGRNCQKKGLSLEITSTQLHLNKNHSSSNIICQIHYILYATCIFLSHIGIIYQ